MFLSSIMLLLDVKNMFSIMIHDFHINNNPITYTVLLKAKYFHCYELQTMAIFKGNEEQKC